MFKGGMKKKELAAAMQQLESLDENSPRLILATGKFLGEGFDHARLDTLFLRGPSRGAARLRNMPADRIACTSASVK